MGAFFIRHRRSSRRATPRQKAGRRRGLHLKPPHRASFFLPPPRPFCVRPSAALRFLEAADTFIPCETQKSIEQVTPFRLGLFATPPYCDAVFWKLPIPSFLAQMEIWLCASGRTSVPSPRMTSEQPFGCHRLASERLLGGCYTALQCPLSERCRGDERLLRDVVATLSQPFRNPFAMLEGV